MQKLIKFLTSRLHTFTRFETLEHFIIFLETFLYHQRLTWDRKNKHPIPTRKTKLIPWYTQSALVIFVACAIPVKVVLEILAYKKDPEFTLTTGLMFSLFQSILTISVVNVFTYIFKIDELRFGLGNLWKMKNTADANFEPSKLLYTWE